MTDELVDRVVTAMSHNDTGFRNRNGYEGMARAAIAICRADPSFDLRLTEDEAEELVKREWISGGGDMDKITAGQAFYCIEKHGAFRPDPDPPVPQFETVEEAEKWLDDNRWNQWCCARYPADVDAVKRGKWQAWTIGHEMSATYGFTQLSALNALIAAGYRKEQPQ